MTVKIDVRVPLEHGVIFLSDPYAEPEIPRDTGAGPVTATSSCIAVWVAAYVDGEAELTLSDLRPPDASEPIFRGSTSVESGVISASDSGAFHWAMVPIKGKTARLDIWRDVMGDADRVWVRVNDLNAS